MDLAVCVAAALSHAALIVRRIVLRRVRIEVLVNPRLPVVLRPALPGAVHLPLRDRVFPGVLIALLPVPVHLIDHALRDVRIDGIPEPDLLRSRAFAGVALSDFSLLDVDRQRPVLIVAIQRRLVLRLAALRRLPVLLRGTVRVRPVGGRLVLRRLVLRRLLRLGRLARVDLKPQLLQLLLQRGERPGRALRGMHLFALCAVLCAAVLAFLQLSGRFDDVADVVHHVMIRLNPLIHRQNDLRRVRVLRNRL